MWPFEKRIPSRSVKVYVRPSSVGLGATQRRFRDHVSRPAAPAARRYRHEAVVGRCEHAGANEVASEGSIYMAFRHESKRPSPVRSGRCLDADPQPARASVRDRGWFPTLVGVGDPRRRRVDPVDGAVTSARDPDPVAGGRERDRLLPTRSAPVTNPSPVDRSHGPVIGVRDPQRAEPGCDRGRAPTDGDRLSVSVASDDPADRSVRGVRDPHRAEHRRPGRRAVLQRGTCPVTVPSLASNLGHRRVDAVRDPDMIAVGDDPGRPVADDHRLDDAARLRVDDRDRALLGVGDPHEVTGDRDAGRSDADRGPHFHLEGRRVHLKQRSALLSRPPRATGRQRRVPEGDSPTSTVTCRGLPTG